MNITHTHITIPPYISTTWERVSSLFMKETALIVSMLDGREISIPDLTPDIVEHVFSAHAEFLGNQIKKNNLSKDTRKTVIQEETEQFFPLPFSIQTLENMGQMGQMLQHNPAHSDLPQIPPDIAAKIASLAKVISEEEILSMPLPESKCNCLYCQINRILRATIGQNLENEEQKTPSTPNLLKQDENETVTDEDLKFEEWAVQEIRENMYSVTSKLDPKEQYTVYLGTPVGCTCGKSNCEHIVAVLRS